MGAYFAGSVMVLAVGAFFGMSTAFASVPCSSLWANGFPEAGRTGNAGDCHEFVPTAVMLSSGQEMYFQENAGDDPVAKESMDWAAAAFSYASNKYSAFASVPKIRLVYASRPYPGGGGVTPAFTYTEFFALGGEFCPVLIYPASRSFSKEHFMQIVAHEVYHCVQKAAFPDKVTAAAQGWSEGQFWFESIAQFMSNDVYPSHGFEYHPMFGSFDQHMPFCMQSSPYLSEGFFQGLFWKSGSSASAVHSVQAGFGSSGATAVADAMAIPNISERFHEIARDMSFGELKDSSGAEAQWRVEKQVFNVPETASHTINIAFMDFATEPFEIVFPKRGRYRLNVHRPDGAKLSVRKAGDPSWSTAFPAELVVDCARDLKMEGIFTRASSELAANSARIEIQRADNEDCPCVIEDKPTDECLYGQWVADNGTVADFLRRLSNGQMIISNVTGAVKLTFTREGDHSWDYQNLVVKGNPAGNPQVEFTLYWNGINRLGYSNSGLGGQTKVCSKTRSSGVTARAEGRVNGRVITMPAPIQPISGEGTLGYTCSGDTFRYDIMAGNMPLNWVFRRVR